MCRSWMAFALGILLTTGQCLVAEEDDPFADVIPPVPTKQPAPMVIPAPAPLKPVEISIVPRRPASLIEPTDSQKRVYERAAQEARDRKARIEQRRRGVSSTQAFFPSSGPLASPSLFRIDPGIRAAFRPIELSGLEPLPNMRPPHHAIPKKPLPRSAKPKDEVRPGMDPAAEIAVPSAKP